MSYSVGERYWVQHDEHAWLVGTLKEFKNSAFEFQTDKGTVKFRVADLKQKLEPCGSHIDDSVENLVDLDELSEGAILHHVRNRFNKKHIYTHVGSILVAVNPFETLDIYGERDIRRAQDASTPYPHVFVTAATAYAQLQENRKNQSVLISGESGAGKTETTKKVLTYLANVAPASNTVKSSSGSSEAGMETKILQSNPLLEALGNAKTLRNNNSSRFGKWMKVGFDKAYRIQGCEIINYLLEKSRVVAQSPQERNYHIFYQLLSGADRGMKERLHLAKAEDYFYTNQSGCTTIEHVDDTREFKDTLQAMSTLQFSVNTIENITKILAGILNLGNISYGNTPNTENACISSEGQVFMQYTAELLGVHADMFTFSLVEKKVQMGRGSIISIKLSPTQAVDNRDTLAKTIYSNLFDYVISRVNSTLRTEESNYSIGILDIFGFEVFEVNSFEQLCINYANEKLQSHFNEVIFNVEKMMYEEESIPLEHIQFEDNNECVNLLEGKPYGLLALLEEECSLGTNATDLTYISKLEKTFGTGKPHANKYFVKNKTKPECFTVLHFAGGVEYNITNFLDKNRDTLSVTLKEVMEQSQIPLLVELFAEKPSDLAAAGSNSKKSAKSTLGIQFRNQLISLITGLKATEPHFIRCVKPNHLKKPSIIDGSLALCQLRYAGLFEAIRIRKSGYAYRVSYQTFASTYQIIVPMLMSRREKKKVTDKEAAEIILGALTQERKIPREAWFVGSKTRVFLKNNSDRLILERERSGKVVVYVMKLQKAIRGFIVYMRSQKERLALKRALLKEQEQNRKLTTAAVMIQKHWRGKNVLNMMRSMNNLIELRRVLAKRETHRIKEILVRIDQDFATLSNRHRKASNKGNSEAESKELMVWNMFEHEIKVAKIMLRLLEIQDQLIHELKNAIEKQNVSDLNRLILKSERLELSQHPLVMEGRELLLKLHKKRTIMKSLIRFLSNEDEYSEQILDVIEEAKVYDVDPDFIRRVQTIFNNAGPRLKTRNRLRAAIEMCNAYAIEQNVLEVMQIREQHSSFAEAELRAARSMLRMLYFDTLLNPKGDPQTADEESKDKDEKKIWGEALRMKAPCLAMLTPQLVDICHAITDSSFPAIRKMHKLKLIEAAGSLERVYEVIRYFKWSRLLCTWKYPEIVATTSAPPSVTHSMAHVDMKKQNQFMVTQEMLDEDDIDAAFGGTAVSPNTSFKPIKKGTEQLQNIFNKMNTTVDNGDHGESAQEEFYGLHFQDARSNPFIIRSLHQDFDIFVNNNKSAMMEAALSSIDLTSSMQDTLVNLDLMNDIDKRIILPNGEPMSTLKKRHVGINYATQEGNPKSTVRPTTTARSPMSTFNASQSSPLARSAQQVFSGYATASREKIVRKAAMPMVSVRRVEDLDESSPEKQLHISRTKKAEEIQRRSKEITKDRRSDMTRLWK